MITYSPPQLTPSDLPAMVILKALEDADKDQEAREFLLSDHATWYTSLLGIRRDVYLKWIQKELNSESK